MDIKKIKNQLPQLAENKIHSQDVKDYFQFYGLDLANETIEHRLGTFKSGDFTLCGQIFKPKEYKAAAIIVHGYTAHCGLLNKIIKYLLDYGFAVCCFDLPGHGLSNGKFAAIDDFSQYSDCLADFLKVIKPMLNRSHINLKFEISNHLIGHSTGAAIIMDYLLSGRNDCFDKVILAAPLVRSELWKISKIGLSICRPFRNSLPRIFRKISSDKDFLKFIKYQDPLSAKKFSIKWVDAMFEWNEKITGNNPAIPTSHGFGGQAVLAGLTNKEIERPMLIIQGTKDNIVNWRHNIRFIQSKFRNSEIELLENARHELFNESQQYRDEVFSLLKDYITK
jgi:alpha-beta hydrolase superfamily lysophospholipase